MCYNQCLVLEKCFTEGGLRQLVSPGVEVVGPVVAVDPGGSYPDVHFPEEPLRFVLKGEKIRLSLDFSRLIHFCSKLAFFLGHRHVSLKVSNVEFDFYECVDHMRLPTHRSKTLHGISSFL